MFGGMCTEMCVYAICVWYVNIPQKDGLELSKVCLGLRFKSAIAWHHLSRLPGSVQLIVCICNIC